LLRNVFQFCEVVADSLRAMPFATVDSGRIDSEHQQFAVNAPNAPMWVCHAPLSNPVVSLLEFLATWRSKKT